MSNMDQFQLIDVVQSLDLREEKIVCRTQLPEHGEIFAGHFPGYPLFPGNLQTEMMAQSSGLYCLASARLGQVSFLSGVENARFRKMVRPGASLTVVSTCAYSNGVMSVFDCQLECSGQRVAESKVRLTHQKILNEDLSKYMLSLAHKTSLISFMESEY